MKTSTLIIIIGSVAIAGTVVYLATRSKRGAGQHTDESEVADLTDDDKFDRDIVFVKA